MVAKFRKTGRSEMKSIQLKNRVGGALIAFAIIFGIGIASSMTAQAQWRNDDQRRDREWRRNRDRDRDRDRDGDRNNDYWARQRERQRREDYYRRNGGNGTYGTNGGYG